MAFAAHAMLERRAKPVELVMAGQVPATVRQAADRRARRPLDWLGGCAREAPGALSLGDLLFSADFSQLARTR